MTNQKNLSFDDALERQRSENVDFNVGKRDRQIQEGDLSASELDVILNALRPDYPLTDCDIDEHELYDIGPTSSTGVDVQDYSDEDWNAALYAGQ